MNSLVEKMLRAIKEKDEKFLQFGDFVIMRDLGHGQQGIVVLAKSPNNRFFSIKLYSPTDENRSAIEKGKERFAREAKILLKLRHRNIANVHLGGSAKWDTSRNKWLVSTDFAHPGEVPYYVMDYVKGDNVKSLFYSGYFRKRMQYRIAPHKSSEKTLNLFEELVIQVSDAMKFFHDKGVVHRDIKPDNIIYSAHDKTFVIVDFGFARYVKKDALMSYQDIIVKKPYIDLESEQQGKVDHLADQFMFAKMLLEIVQLFRPPFYPDRYFRGLISVLEKAASPRRDMRYANMEEFRKAIEPYLYSYPYQGHNFQIGAFLIPIRRFGHFFSKIRIPFSGSVPVSREILEIIDTSDFQRLRGVSQLGPCQFVYPGANHTRFEHSIGAYYLALRYLQVLLKNPYFYEAVEDVEEAIKLVVLAALLHDIGHYPYSHWIEELTGLPDDMTFDRHEERAKEIILERELGDIIETRWQADPIQVCRLISGGTFSSREELLRSIIDSDIDVDKIDYLQRDSAHCGVPYGLSFDVSRLTSSLWINEKRNKICLTEKGRSSFAALVMSNIIMYQEVYWHKTVRACNAMFKRFFYEFLERSMVSMKTTRRRYLSYSDEMFIGALWRNVKGDEELSALLRPFVNRGRILYKPAYVHYHGHELYVERESTKRLFDLLASKDYVTQVEMSRSFAGEIKKHIPELKSLDVILETTPITYREVAELSGFEFYDTKKGEYEAPTSEIKGLNRYLETNRRSYIFCKPKYYDRIRALQGNNVLNRVMAQVAENFPL